MNYKKILSCLLLFLLLIPTHAFAVDFEITEVDIKAQLNPDGSADVTEQHTYEFDGDFEGITRSLVAKEGTSIEDFSAFENGDPLKVEQEDGLYKIFRDGDDETIQVVLRYDIQNAVEKYQDGAEFYWPFFDDNNESEYGDMMITIIPPAPAEDVEFLGYDAAYDKGSLDDSGVVVFRMGQVPDETGGDVRAVFEAELFPALTAQEGTVRDDIASDREQLEEDAAIFAQNQQTAKKIGIPALLIAGSLFLLMALMAWLRSISRKRRIEQSSDEFFVPKETMSIPALLYFTNSAFLSPNALASSLLELVRKGSIEQLSEDRFRLLNRKADFGHEAVLIDLLFDRVGDGKEFNLPGVEEFTKEEKNHEAYNEAIHSWNKGIADEVKSHGFHEKQPVQRSIAGLLSLVFIGLAIYTGIYELFPWMAAAIILAMFAFVFAVGYSPLTAEGHQIRQQWRQMKKAMENLPQEQWQRLSMDEKQRAYAYLLGSDQKTAEKKAAVFASGSGNSNATDFMISPILMTAIFVAAGTNTSAHASGGSSVPGAGTGVGGGGGGSGAF